MSVSLNVGSVRHYSPDIFGADAFPIHAKTVILTGSQTVSQAGAPTTTTLLAGSVLGIVTSGGKALLSVHTAVDGSQTAVGILANDTETSGGDSVVTIYVSGSFLADKLLYGGSDTIANQAATFNSLNIYVENSQTYPDGSWNS